MRAEPNRPLSDAERTLVVWFLEGLEPRRAELLAQVPVLRVVHHCECGCPTVEFAVRGKRRDYKKPDVILAEAVGPSPEGVDLDIILWMNQGDLTGVEFVSHSGASAFTVPAPSALKRVPVVRAV